MSIPFDFVKLSIAISYKIIGSKRCTEISSFTLLLFYRWKSETISSLMNATNPILCTTLRQIRGRLLVYLYPPCFEASEKQLVLLEIEWKNTNNFSASPINLYWFRPDEMQFAVVSICCYFWCCCYLLWPFPSTAFIIYYFRQHTPPYSTWTTVFFCHFQLVVQLRIERNSLNWSPLDFRCHNESRIESLKTDDDEIHFPCIHDIYNFMANLCAFYFFLLFVYMIIGKLVFQFSIDLPL